MGPVCMRGHGYIKILMYQTAHTAAAHAAAAHTAHAAAAAASHAVGGG